MEEHGRLENEVAAVKRITGRDLSAMLTDAFDAEQARLHAYALAALRDSAAAEDVVAETFARLVREAYAGRTPENIGAWLFRVCGNLIVSGGRRRSVASRWLGRLVDRRTPRTPEEAAIAHEADREMVDALARLSREARVALLMAAEGASMAEIAQTLGRTTEATRTFVCRSRLKLRETLARDSAAVGR